MNAKEIMQIFEDTAYIRTGGTPEELRTAEYIRDKAAGMGLNAQIVPFEVPMANILEEAISVDGVSLECKGYFCSGDAEVEAPFYYMPDTDKLSVSRCRGKVVMVDSRMGYWKYQDIREAGALGFITYGGDIRYTHRDIDRRELRSMVHQGHRIPGIHINAKDAVRLIHNSASTAKITLKQEEYTGHSHNVILDLPGELEEYICFSAHYDTTSLSQGAYDNMSGSIGLLSIAEHFAKNPHRYGLRFVWCGSEERGLLGSKAYCQEAKDLDKCVLNINLDMIGCAMGKFIACCTTEEAMVHYLKYFSFEDGFPVNAYQDVYSSDSTPFADCGVPAISFARISTENTGTIHNRYDTIALMKGEQMVEDIGFITRFTERMANAALCPVTREIPQNMKDKLEEYLCRKRPKNM